MLSQYKYKLENRNMNKWIKWLLENSHIKGKQKQQVRVYFTIIIDYFLNTMLYHLNKFIICVDVYILYHSISKSEIAHFPKFLITLLSEDFIHSCLISCFEKKWPLSKPYERCQPKYFPDTQVVPIIILHDQ